MAGIGPDAVVSGAQEGLEGLEGGKQRRAGKMFVAHWASGVGLKCPKGSRASCVIAH